MLDNEERFRSLVGLIYLHLFDLSQAFLSCLKSVAGKLNLAIRQLRKSCEGNCANLYARNVML